jgi:hydroxypyruvate reductase
MIGSAARPVCIISSGETTVTVRGRGKGGRNQEFAFAMAGHSRVWARCRDKRRDDGIDGPTDAAGAIVDTTTFTRAQAAGMTNPQQYLENNDTYAFFDRLGDLIRTGPRILMSVIFRLFSLVDSGWWFAAAPPSTNHHPPSTLR